MKSFLTKIYLYKFFDDLIILYPIYTIMFSEYGLNPMQISIVLALWSTTSFLFEVPSGVWADRYSRRNILILGQLLRAIGYFIWIIYPTFVGFAFGFVLWGIKSALTSGTYQAYIYDELAAKKKNSQYGKVLGRSKTLSYIAILMASVLASPAILYGYPFVVGLSCVAVVISAMSIVWAPKATQIESTKENSFYNILKVGLKISFRNPKVLAIIIFLSLAFALGGSLDEFWSLFANESGLDKASIGIFFAIMSGMQALGSFYAHRFNKFSDDAYYVFFLINGVFLIVAGYLYSIPALLLLIVFSFSFTILQTIFEVKLQHSIKEDARATVASVSGFLTEIFAITVYIGFGLLAEISSYRLSFIVAGGSIVLVGCIYWILWRRGVIGR